LIALTTEPLHNENELFQRIANGDEDAFAKIFFHYTSIIHPFVLNKVKSQAAAEEIVQDVFLKLWTKREMLRTLESPASYLMRIATNRTLDHLRRKAVEYRVLQKEGWTEDKASTENEFSFKEAKRILDEAIAAMPAQRRTIYLLQQEGYSYDEIAAQLNISNHTVRNHIALASKYLKDYLKSHGLSIFVIMLLAGK
jgi:RNA polymerase sigma-70 factor (ECF subfamily)